MANKGWTLETDPTSPYCGRWVAVGNRKPDVMQSWGAKVPDQPIFNIEAIVPGAMDADMGRSPTWCDLILRVERVGTESTDVTYMTRNAGESMIEALHSALHPWAGKNVQAELWNELDAVMTLLIANAADPDDKGKAQGLAFALAVITNPYAPNIDAIRALALERAGVEPDDDETDEMWDGLMPLGMIELRSIAEDAGVPKYKQLGHDALVSLLWTNDIGSDGPVTTSPYWDEPEPEPEPEPAESEPDDDWGEGL
jgi:hypothetical protein